MIPKPLDLTLPLLEICRDGRKYTYDTLIPILSDKFDLTEEERNEFVPSGQMLKIKHRLTWAKWNLKKAELLTNDRNFCLITQAGLDVLDRNPIKIDQDFLNGIPAYRKNIRKNNHDLESIPSRSRSDYTVDTTKYENILKKKKQLIFYGPPGTGKTYYANIAAKNFTMFSDYSYLRHDQYIKRVTFHQSYSYENFVEGIRPRAEGAQVSYELEPGIFKEISDDARNDPSHRYVLIIDEINRGNVSKIFGELITLIEKDKRKSMSLQLAYSKNNFNVPENLYIIGTMNTADQSLAQLDTALRRRFAFCELMPQPNLLKKTISGISLEKLLDTLNQKIRNAGLHEKQIGHSYFMNVNDVSDLHFVFIYEIMPLLQDYFFDDYEKLANDILSDDFVDVENMMIKQDWQEDKARFIEILK